MPPGIDVTRSKRLAYDLRRIREKHGISKHKVYESTRLPPDLIDEFERTALLHHPQYNLVYVKSFVRSYAGVVGISPEHALEAVEAAAKGQYVGSLAVIYLGEKPVVPLDDSVKEEPVERVEKVEDRIKSVEVPFRFDRVLESEDIDVEEPEDSITEEEPGDAESMDVVPKYDAVGPLSSRRTWLYIGAGIVVTALLIIGYFALFGSARQDGTIDEGQTETPVVEDSTAMSYEAYVPPRRIIPPPGDTMKVHIIAANDKILGIRVTVDNDLRRPYWSEEGDSLEYSVTDRIVIEEQLDRILLSVEGERYPVDRVDSIGRIVITRDSVIQYFESLNR